MANDNYLNLTGLCQFYNNLKNLFASKEAATTLSDGLMSLSDKEKLDGIAKEANNYIHPDTSGSKHIPSGGFSGQILAWSADGTAKWINHDDTIDGITDSLTAANSNIALSAKAGNDLQKQIHELNSEFANLTPQNIGAFPCMILPHNTDLNTLMQPGMYRVWNEDEDPYGHKAVLVIETDEEYISQVALEEGYSFGMAMRYYNPIDGWSDWSTLENEFLRRHAKADSAAYADDAAHAANADNAANATVSASANAVIGIPFQNTDPGIDRNYHLATDGGTNPVQWIHRSNMCVGHLGRSGDTNVPMTFHWNGQPGQPDWVWGGNNIGNGQNMYVWNPANFSVNYADTAHGLRTYNEAGNSYGESWVLKCKYNIFADGAFGLYVQHNGGGIMGVRADRAAMDAQGNDIAATYLPKSGGDITGEIQMNGKCLRLEQAMPYRQAMPYIKGENGMVRIGFSSSASGTFPELLLNGNGGELEYFREFRPNEDGTFNFGAGNFRWKQVYAASPAISTSDRKLKDNIAPLTDRHLKFFAMLQPVSFVFIDGSSGRTHIGFVSQDVEAAMTECGLTDLDFGGFCKDAKTIRKIIEDEDGSKTETEEPVLDEDGNPVYIYSLRYEEFIALNTYAIQTTMARLDILEERIKNIEDRAIR